MPLVWRSSRAMARRPRTSPHMRRERLDLLAPGGVLGSQGERFPQVASYHPSTARRKPGLNGYQAGAARLPRGRYPPILLAAGMVCGRRQRMAIYHGKRAFALGVAGAGIAFLPAARRTVGESASTLPRDGGN